MRWGLGDTSGGKLAMKIRQMHDEEDEGCLARVNANKLEFCLTRIYQEIFFQVCGFI